MPLIFTFVRVLAVAGSHGFVHVPAATSFVPVAAERARGPLQGLGDLCGVVRAGDGGESGCAVKRPCAPAPGTAVQESSRDPTARRDRSSKRRHITDVRRDIRIDGVKRSLADRKRDCPELLRSVVGGGSIPRRRSSTWCFTVTAQFVTSAQLPETTASAVASNVPTPASASSSRQRTDTRRRQDEATRRSSHPSQRGATRRTRTRPPPVLPVLSRIRL